jgi:hypothetical protein
MPAAPLPDSSPAWKSLNPLWWKDVFHQDLQAQGVRNLPDLTPDQLALFNPKPPASCCHYCPSAEKPRWNFMPFPYEMAEAMNGDPMKVSYANPQMNPFA